MLLSRLLAPLLFSASLTAQAQTAPTWNGKPCAVVLTYDDALDGHLNQVVPALDSLGLRGTFYLIGSAPVMQRVAEWRRAAAKGHELGNHSLMHPCDGTRPGRAFVTPDTDLSRYSVSRAVAEIRAANTLLTAIDGRSRRTFAYPCGDRQIGGVYFYEQLRPDFVAARGVSSGLQTSGEVNPDDIHAVMINGQSGAQLIQMVKEAQQQRKLLVFLFHGVGGGHGLNVDAQAHRQLLRYLKAQERDIWVAPMVEVAGQVQAQQAARSGASVR